MNCTRLLDVNQPCVYTCLLLSLCFQCWHCGSGSPFRDDCGVLDWRYFTGQLEVHDQRSRELYSDRYRRWGSDWGFLYLALEPRTSGAWILFVASIQIYTYRRRAFLNLFRASQNLKYFVL